MKVIKRGTGKEEHNVLEESAQYYLCGERPDMHPYLLRKADYEPVQEWVDVTHECSTSWTCASGSQHTQEHVSHNGYRLASLYKWDASEYRLTLKVEVLK